MKITLTIEELRRLLVGDNSEVPELEAEAAGLSSEIAEKRLELEKLGETLRIANDRNAAILENDALMRRLVKLTQQLAAHVAGDATAPAGVGASPEASMWLIELRRITIGLTSTLAVDPDDPEVVDLVEREDVFKKTRELVVAAAEAWASDIGDDWWKKAAASMHTLLAFVQGPRKLLDKLAPVEVPAAHPAGGTVVEEAFQPEQHDALDDGSAVHLAHCYRGENADGCKYGDADCPAAPAQALAARTLEELPPAEDDIPL